MNTPFSEIPLGQKVIEIVRWIILVPASFLAGSVAQMVVAIGNSSACTGGRLNPESSTIDRFIVTVLVAAAAAIATIYASALIAPRFQKETATVMSFMYAIVLVVANLVYLPIYPETAG